MAYCTDPRNHRKGWWSNERFEHFDWRRNRIVPSKTAWVHCEVCHNHWGTTNRELVDTLPMQRPELDKGLQ